MLSAFTYRFREKPLRFARRFRGWPTAALVPVAVTLSVTAMIVPIAFVQGSVAAQASASANVNVLALAPAPEQTNPTDLWRSTPIPAVAAAVKLARRNAPMPTAIVPSMQELESENATGDGIIPKGCMPSFGSGATSEVCRLGDGSSRRVVVVLGDSQAGTWMPGLVAVGRAQHFAVVPLVKPGCFVVRVKTNLPGWPCSDWFRWTLAQDKALHPVATIVSFLLWAPLQRHPASTASYMRFVLSHVRNGVFLSDHPMQDQRPPACIYKSDANMRKCSVRVPSAYVTLMKALARMTARTHHPVIPSLQWFCADGICPMVINHTLTTRDRDHMTKEYSAALAPLLSLELKPILARLERR